MEAQTTVMGDGENGEVGVPGAPAPENPPVEDEPVAPPPAEEPPPPPVTEAPPPTGTEGEPWNP